MTANTDFLKQGKEFWSQVKLVSMSLGYSTRDNKVKNYKIQEVMACLKDAHLQTNHLVDPVGRIMPEGALLLNYFDYRAEVLFKQVEPNLMDREQAKAEFDKLFSTLNPKVLLPLNKQKGEKRHYAYLTGIVNMLTEQALGGLNFDANPRKLVVISRDQKPIRTLSRWYDGTYPSTTNPISLWEIKEYYGTTTFGSRVADGVYETMLDGNELEDLRLSERIDVKHYLMVDDYFTWWKCGKSYLCRIIDMLHEGLLDEVLFGREVVSRWPNVVKSWPRPSTTSTVIDRERLLQP